MAFVLSKSSFAKGCQCLKQLYFHKHHAKLQVPKPDQSDSQHLLFQSGVDIGKLAHKYFPGGIDCSPDSAFDYSRSIEQTSLAVSREQPVIYEAAFRAENVLVAVDILRLTDNGWCAYEVKSSTRVKDSHKLDAAIQYWTMRHAGLHLDSIHIMHINKHYKRQGALDVQQLFVSTDVTHAVRALQDYVSMQVHTQTLALDSESIPSVDIGPHCTSPYICEYQDHCYKAAGVYDDGGKESSVLNLSNARGRQWDLWARGIRKIRDIPQTEKLSEGQRIQVRCEQTRIPHIDRARLKQFLEEMRFPLIYMDFEAFASAVPPFDGCHPHQHICFQYSLHKQCMPFENSNQELLRNIEHKSFLADGKGDPRVEFIERLLADTGDEGSVLVYHKPFEDARLAELARDFPKYEINISRLRRRLVDLAVPFQKKMYYTPLMGGKYSIKNVLAATIPELQNSYKDLGIRDGFTASMIYANMMNGDYKDDTIRLRESLLEYCKLDTWAMVRVLQHLTEVLKK